MDEFLLDPGAGEPAVVITGLRFDLFGHLGKFQAQEEGGVHRGPRLVDMDFEGADHVTAEIEDQSVISLASVGGKLVNLLFTLCGSPAAQPGGIFDDIDDPGGAVLRLYDLRPVGFGLGKELFVMFEFKAVIDLKSECHCIFYSRLDCE